MSFGKINPSVHTVLPELYILILALSLFYFLVCGLQLIYIIYCYQPEFHKRKLLTSFMLVFNVLPLGNKSILFALLCDPESDPINVSLWPAGIMLHLVSRGSWRDTAEEGAFLSDCNVLLPFSCCSSAGQCAGHPMKFISQ